MTGAVTTSAPVFTSSFMNVISPTSFSEEAFGGELDGTTPVDVVESPSSGSRLCSEVTLYNADSVAITAVFSLNDNGAIRPIRSITLEPGATWEMSTQTAIDGAPGTNGADGLDGNQYPASVRISVVSGDPNPQTDQSAKTNVYVMPYNGNIVPLWDGIKIVAKEFSELTAALNATYQTATNVYDVYAFDDGGIIRVGFGVAWSSATARGTGAGTAEIEAVNGVDVNKNSMIVRNGAASYTVGARYGTLVGTVAPSTNGQLEWTVLRREICNRYNLEKTFARRCPGYNNNGSTTSITINSTSFIEVNGTNNGRVYFVLCKPQKIRVDVAGFGGTGGGYLRCGFGIDSLVALTEQYSAQSISSPIMCQKSVNTSIGLHYAVMIACHLVAAATLYVDSVATGQADTELSYVEVGLEM
jgi:hypothetical protein